MPGLRATLRFERWILRRLLASMGDPSISIVLPDGSEIVPPGQPPASRVTVRDRWTLYKLAINPLFQFPEAYTSGAIDVEGIEALLTTALSRLNDPHAQGTWLDRILRYVRLPRRNTLSKSRDNVHHHYNIGNDFYQLWLDRNMVYTCAYFAEPSLSLEQAQTAKLDHVCRKLRLRPGMRVIEAGCGWGALAIHMAKHYGVTVRAFNISREQIDYAREQARHHQLQGRVEFIEEDWRNISGRCDAFVSVGMLEHVGTSSYRKLGDVIDACLEPDALGLIHFIGQNYPCPLNRWIERRIFPGAYPPALREVMDVFEPHGFSVLDVENLRLHYAETLKHWLQRYEESRDVVLGLFDEQFVRSWRMYLTSSMVTFRCGGLQLFQIVFARGTNNDVPLTREFLYAHQQHVSIPRDGVQGRMTPPSDVNAETKTYGGTSE